MTYQAHLSGMEPQPPREQVECILQFLNVEIDSYKSDFVKVLEQDKDALPNRIISYRKVTHVLNNAYFKQKIAEYSLQDQYMSVVQNLTEFREAVNSSRYAYADDFFHTEKVAAYTDEVLKKFPVQFPSEERIENRV